MGDLIQHKSWCQGQYRVTRFDQDGRTDLLVERYIAEQWSSRFPGDGCRQGHWQTVSMRHRQLRAKIIRAYEAATKPRANANDNQSEPL